MEKIAAGKHVTLAYKIFAVDEQAEDLMYEFTADHPYTFVYGNDPGMLPHFMAAIEGLEPGQEFDFTLGPEQAFGARSEEMVVSIPRSEFLIDGKFDNEKIYVGAVLTMQVKEENYLINGLVTDIDDENVQLDFNHELAGERLHYAGKVLAVRDATPDDLKPHCGCGCDCGHDHGSSDCGGCGGCH